jgi:hypothetical protein
MSEALSLSDSLCRMDTFTEYQSSEILKAAAELRRLAGVEAELQQARAELAALRAVPGIPEPLECLHISRGSADAAADEYAAEYWAHLAQGKADADLRRGALQTVGYYVRDTLRRYQASPQAPQPAQPRKPLFEDLIAQHPGLREELILQDAQPVEPACPVCSQTPVFEHDRRTGEWAGHCKNCAVEGSAATTETEARRLWIAWHHKRSDATPALFNTPADTRQTAQKDTP